MKNTLVGFGILCASFGVSNAADALGAVDNIQRAALVRSTIMERDIEMGVAVEESDFVSCLKAKNELSGLGVIIKNNFECKVSRCTVAVMAVLFGGTLVYFVAPKFVGF